MKADQVKTMQQELEERFQKLNIETAWLEGEEGQIGDTLRALLPVTKTGDHVLLEVMVTRLDEDMVLLDLFISLIMEVGPGYEALKETMLDWNLDSPIGAFGIYRPGRTFYHRYTFPFPCDALPEELASQAAYLIDRCYDVVAAVFPEAVRISGHA